MPRVIYFIGSGLILTLTQNQISYNNMLAQLLPLSRQYHKHRLPSLPPCRPHGAGGHRGHQHPEDTAAAITLNSWHLTDKETDSEITCSKKLVLSAKIFLCLRGLSGSRAKTTSKLSCYFLNSCCSTLCISEGSRIAVIGFSETQHAN